MERKFTHENFEESLKQSADSLRMRPDERVWHSIASHLNRRNRRIGFIFGSLFITLSGIGYLLISNHSLRLHSVPLAYLHPASGSLIHNRITGKDVPAESNNIPEVQKTPTAGSAPARVIPINSDNGFITRSGLFISPSDHAVPAFDPLIRDANFGKKSMFSEFSTGLLPESLKNPSIEGSVERLYIRKHPGKPRFQVYFTPTVSYRILGENKAYSHPSGFSLGYSPYPNIYNINSAVTHKPDFGFELGFAFKQPVSRNLTIRGGLQFNVNRYDIKAFTIPSQLTTIQLNNRYSPDSLSAVSSYSNLNGYHTDWLQNFYFEISAPVGLELKLRGDDKIQFGIAATVQPTYLLSGRQYLLSSDYKNYAEVPWLIRRWNVNTSFEPYVSYSTGHLKWQVGPQFRYQLKSSFIKQYPITENLYNFGLRVGISLNN